MISKLLRKLFTVPIECSAEFPLPVSEVWNLATDPSCQTVFDLSGKIESVQYSGPLAPGCITMVKLKRGKSLAFYIDVVEKERKLVFHQKVFPMHKTICEYDFTSVRVNVTRVDVKVEFVNSGALFLWIFKRVIRAQLEKSLKLVVQRAVDYVSAKAPVRH